MFKACELWKRRGIRVSPEQTGHFENESEDFFAQLIRSCCRTRNVLQGKQIHARILASEHRGKIYLANQLVQMYSACGSLDQARTVFDSISQHNVFSWNIMIAAYGQNGYMDEACSLFGRMTERNVVSWNTMCQAYAQNGHIHEAQNMLERMPEHNVVSWNAIIAVYAQNWHLQEAKCMFDRIPECNMVSWNTLITVYAQTGDLQAAKNMFERMPERDKVSWSTVISAYAQNGHLEQAKSMLDLLPQTDLVSWTSVTRAYAQNGYLEEAKMFFDKMPQHDAVSWTIMILANARNGHIHEAQSMFLMMPHRDPVTCTTMITAYGQNGDLERAKSLFDRMPQWDLVSWTAMVGAYGENKHLDNAKDMFDTMPRRNVVSWNAVTAAYAQKGHLEKAKSTFDGMPERNVMSWNIMVSAYAQNGYLEESKSFFFRMPQHDSVSWNSMCQAYALKGYYEEAKCTFDKMPRHDVVAWNSMMAAYNQNGDLKAAKGMFDRMPVHNTVSWNSMITGCSHNGHFEEAKALFDKIPEKDAVSWTTMVGAHSENGDVEGAKSMFDEMPRRDVVSWNIMITAYAHTSHLEEVRSMFKKIPRRDAVSWTAMVAADAQNGHLEEAKSAFDMAPERNVVSWNAMAAAYAQSDLLEEAKSLFHKMAQRDAVSWTALVAGYARNGHLVEAKRTFESMPEDDVVAWNAMIAGYAQNGHLEDAKNMFDRMTQQDVVSWTILIGAYARNGCLEDVRSMFEEMPNRNVVSWNAVIAAYAQNGHGKTATELFHLMNLEGVKPDEVSFMSVLPACSHIGSMDNGLRYFTCIASDYGLIPTREHYCCMIDILGRAGRLKDAEDLISNMPFLPDDVAWRTLLGACRMHRDVQRGRLAAERVFELDPEGSPPYLLLANIYAAPEAETSVHSDNRLQPTSYTRFNMNYGRGGCRGPDVRLVDQGNHVILDNGIVQVTLSKPGGIVTCLGYGGIDNLLEVHNKETNRGYWDLNWNEPGGKDNFDVPNGTIFHVICNDGDKVELSFVRPYLPGSKMLPLNIDKRFALLRGSSGFYTYGIYERPHGWPDFSLNQTRVTFKLRKDRFQYMSVSDSKQRIMPSPDDRLPQNCTQLAYPEAVILVNPQNSWLRGEVDDKYQYSCDNRENRVHGWVSSNPVVGFWIITASDEFRNGGPLKQNLTSHVGPTCLSMFHSAHYAGAALCPEFRNGEAWTKVFGPVFIYLNSAPTQADPCYLWEDAKQQMLAEVESWPVSWPASPDFPKAAERGGISGRLLVKDSFVLSTPFAGHYAFLGLAAPGEKGSWQTESKGYQFWAQADANGYFHIKHVRAGRYDLYGWVPGILGDYKREDGSIEIHPGSWLQLGDLIYEPPRDGPTVWEIGIPDRTAAEFYIPDPNPKYINKLFVNHPEKYRHYGLWEQYSELYPDNDLVFTVGQSNWRTDWFFAHNCRIDKDGSLKASTWQIRFHLTNIIQSGTYKLRLAFAASNNAAIQVRVNDPNVRTPIFDTMQFGKDNTIARHGIHGLYHLWSIDIRPQLLKQGENTLFLTQRKPTSPVVGVMYDYIRLEAPPTSGTTCDKASA